WPAPCRRRAGACRPPGTPSTKSNTCSRRCLRAGKARRLMSRRAGHRAQCGSSLQPRGASGLPAGCCGQASRTTPGWRWISVSSSLLEGYDEPEILRSSSHQFCLTSAEAGHELELLPEVLIAAESGGTWCGAGAAIRVLRLALRRLAASGEPCDRAPGARPTNDATRR